LLKLVTGVYIVGLRIIYGDSKPDGMHAIVYDAANEWTHQGRRGRGILIDNARSTTTQAALPFAFVEEKDRTPKAAARLFYSYFSCRAVVQSVYRVEA
jgi:hypothetical protein